MGDLTEEANGAVEGTRAPYRRDRSEVITRRIAMASLVVAASAVLLAAVLFAWFEGEARQRRDANCQSFELGHRQEVEDLAGAYKLVAASPPASWDRLQRFVAARIPTLERDAASDSDGQGVNVPGYCDEPGVGLPEPDPCLPPRPVGLELKAQAPPPGPVDCRPVEGQ